jgi:hypothetical protein
MQAHRFQNAAALSLAGGGETRYLTAETAEELGEALIRIAKSIRKEQFSASPDLTFRFESFKATWTPGFKVANQ